MGGKRKFSFRKKINNSPKKNVRISAKVNPKDPKLIIGLKMNNGNTYLRKDLLLNITKVFLIVYLDHRNIFFSTSNAILAD